MSDERPSTRHRIGKVARYVKGKLTSLSKLSRPPAVPSIDMDSVPDHHIATTDTLTAGTSDLPFNMILVAGVDHAPTIGVASTEASTVSSPTSVPFSASIPVVHRELGSVSSLAPETLPTHMSPNNSPMPPFQGVHSTYMAQPNISMASNVQTRPQILGVTQNTHSPMTVFQGAHDVTLRNSTINMANTINLHAPSNPDGNEQSKSRIIVRVFILWTGIIIAKT
ncbi:hypothetical protein BYT27DRAFT_6654042 [Phlegmacium glaucopus]|nr:hypothetical protein BYT27DRAFT_6654042 [Phlegmacium glaucopus]